MSKGRHYAAPKAKAFSTVAGGAKKSSLGKSVSTTRCAGECPCRCRH